MQYVSMFSEMKKSLRQCFLLVVCGMVALVHFSVRFYFNFSHHNIANFLVSIVELMIHFIKVMETVYSVSNAREVTKHTIKTTE